MGGIFPSLFHLSLIGFLAPRLKTESRLVLIVKLLELVRKFIVVLKLEDCFFNSLSCPWGVLLSFDMHQEQRFAWWLKKICSSKRFEGNPTLREGNAPLFDLMKPDERENDPTIARTRSVWTRAGKDMLNVFRCLICPWLVENCPLSIELIILHHYKLFPLCQSATFIFHRDSFCHDVMMAKIVSPLVMSSTTSY